MTRPNVFKTISNLVDPYQPYVQSDTPPQKLWPFFLSVTRPYRGILIALGCCSVLVGVIEVALIAYLGRIVDFLASGTDQFWHIHGVELLLAAAFLLLLRPLIQLADVILLNNAVLPGLTTLIRWRAHRHVLRQPIGWFENDFAGRIANRLMQAPSSAGEVIYHAFDAIAFFLAYIVGAAILMSSADARLFIPLGIYIAFYSMLTVWTIKRVGPASQAAADARSMTTGRVVDTYSNIHSVKTFGQSDLEEGFAKEAFEKTRRTFDREMRLFTIMEFALVILNGLLMVGLVGGALWFWSTGTASAGIVVAATALTLRLSAMTGWIMWALTTFFRELGVVREGLQSLAAPIELTDKPSAQALGVDGGQIEIAALSHHYGRGQGGLDGVSLVVKPGEKVGLVGRSGAGKSTLMKLILRFYDAEGGHILIDGHDIRDVTQKSLSRAIGMVQQEGALLHRSVYDNIRYANADASEAEIIEAAKSAHAHEFIMDLVDHEGRRGYDAHVGERGIKLSGGQRQRLSLARVILKDAPILLLDEATSALDSEVEAAIQDTLQGLMEGKTVLAIAHRLSTISQMDRIVVLDQGRIKEEGSHADLLAKAGLYAELWARQSGGFIAHEDDRLTPEA